MRILVSGVLTASLVLLTPGLAEAKSHTRRDPAGDVWVGQSVPPQASTRAPEHSEGDISVVRLKHNRKYLQLFMTLRDIKRETLSSGWQFRLQNRRKKLTHVEVRADHRTGGSPDGTLWVTDAFGEPKSCAGTRGFAINWVRNVVAITIPRTCIGNARFVRTQAWSFHFYETTNDIVFRDDGFSNTDPYSRKPRWSPWVRRG